MQKVKVKSQLERVNEYRIRNGMGQISQGQLDAHLLGKAHAHAVQVQNEKRAEGYRDAGVRNF